MKNVAMEKSLVKELLQDKKLSNEAFIVYSLLFWYGGMTLCNLVDLSGFSEDIIRACVKEIKEKCGESLVSRTLYDVLPF